MRLNENKNLVLPRGREVQCQCRIQNIALTFRAASNHSIHDGGMFLPT